MKTDFDEKYKLYTNNLMSVTDHFKNHGEIYIDRNVLEFVNMFFDIYSDDPVLIPNLSYGELALCTKNCIGYTLQKNIKKVIEKTVPSDKINVIEGDFLIMDHTKKYNFILLFPPLGIKSISGRNEVLYIKTCLDMLNDKGRMVAILPRSILSAPAYKELRKQILNGFSLDAVFSIDSITQNSSFKGTIVVIENKNQSNKIYMSVKKEITEKDYLDYQNGKGGFYIDSSDVYDRIDADFYDPKYKDIRSMILNRDTVKLSSIANITSGLNVQTESRDDHGEYIIIKPQYIYNNSIHYDKNAEYCNDDYVISNTRGKKCIIKRGDILISTIGKIDWAFYSGKENNAIANQNVAIIRAKKGNELLLRLFFNTTSGKEYFESQLDFLSHCGVYNHISLQGLSNIAIPNQKVIKTAELVNKNGRDIETKAATLFGDLGWEVKTEVLYDKYYFDVCIYKSGKLYGVIETKSYKNLHVKQKNAIVRQLSSMKELIGDAKLYLFLNDNIYEYINGTITELLEIPRPDNTEIIENISLIDEKSRNNEITMNKVGIEEGSLFDRMLYELITQYDAIMKKLDKIEGKIDDISEKISALSRQISGYQSLVDKQLALAESPEEEDHIIHAFSEECTNRIISEVSENNSDGVYDDELQKLMDSFGESAWNKLDDSSKTFLVSSRIIFNELNNISEIVDYSGVCLLVTKALEVETGKRFCENYIDYLKQKFPGKSNFCKFPTALIDKYGKPIKPNHYTLGTLAYILCYLKPDNIEDEKLKNDKDRLLEYTREKVFSGRTDKEIMELLNEYAEDIEEAKNLYRNPAAHTNMIKRTNAEECFKLVLYVEKLLIRMMDSFAE